MEKQDTPLALSRRTLGFGAAGLSAVLAMRADLMASLRTLIAERGWTQHEAALELAIGQSRVSDLVRGKWEKFSLDMLITLAARVGKRPHQVLEPA